MDGLDDQGSAIGTLVSLREDSGVDFRIVATGWSEDPRVVELLGLGPEQRIRLDRLELDELVEVVRRLGLLGPPGLIHDIVRQAGGSPGLAVTLTMACHGGNVREVVTGAILQRHVRTVLRDLPIDDAKAEIALAAIAVGGDSGMRLDDVAAAIDMPSLELRRLLKDIEAGGVIRPRARGNVSVQPEQLRAVLVAANFWGAYPVPVRPFFDIAPDQRASLTTLIHAAAKGGEPSELRPLVTTTEDAQVFEAYAWLGPDNCRWVLHAHPEFLITVAHAALHYIPAEALPLLVAAAQGDERQLHSTPEHPMRIISDWCRRAQPGEGDALRRRETTVTAALQYLRETGDVGTAVHAIVQVLTIEFEAGHQDPGQGRTYTLERGVLTADEIDAMASLWTRCLESIRGWEDLPWRILLDTARNAASMPPFGDEHRRAETLAAARRLRDAMARDLFDLGSGHPGVAYEARELAYEHDGWPPESPQEQLYGLLFGDPFRENFREREAEVAKKLGALAEEWSRGGPEGPLDELSRLTAASEDVRHRGMDRRLSLRIYPCRAVASRAACAFLKAIRPQASCSRARWFSAFFDQRTSRARLRFSQEWQASTTQRRARQPGVRSLSSISSPRLRMCAVSPCPASSSRLWALS